MNPLREHIAPRSGAARPVRPALILAGLAFFLVVCTLGALKSAAPLHAGVPSFKSLALSVGPLASSETACRRGRGPSVLIVEIDTQDGRVPHMLPCTPALSSALAGKSGPRIEVRSRLFSSYIFNSAVQDIWSVKVDGQELYSYAVRVERYASGNMAFMLVNILLAAAASVWAVRLLRKT